LEVDDEDGVAIEVGGVEQAADVAGSLGIPMKAAT
jgi:hypothetical protein